MKVIDYTTPALVSGSFALLLLVFYLYKSENSKMMHFLSARFMRNRYSPAQIQKDTRSQDAVMLTVLMIMILALGLKMIMLQAVVSDSMVPEFKKGDLILTQTMSKEPQVGDIVTFKARNVINPVTHRVIDIRDNIVITKGDNNPLVDDYFTTRDDIIGKAVVIRDNPVVIKDIGSYFILDFSKEGRLYKYGDKFEFIQQMFLTIRTWGYVLTAIALIALIMSMAGNKI
ncbi:signal peptidase I [Candidatus Methanoperedens nitroreducens]|uniref:Signal peptidase I n=1 Tax=Candidatus Methanoperedens nitratireducens TaxID=1392998 RepID=A0A062V084_9EURY|nr:signal peptidase I [Candidatus Methanoperedens nitroreducens]KCZ70807.1 signal peptidase I [Candidatus Methanoperedens nitroreducens]MDJ1420661.1 signal peptidase I [Candidatus Methanoperedens sp.]